jgi:DNA-binding beta-propeller fold protein YncE
MSMALGSKGRFLLVISALVAAVMLVWSGGVSARGGVIGADRIVSFESLPDGDTCLMPGAESTSLSAAIASMERVPGVSKSAAVCAVPPHAFADQPGQAVQAPSTPEHIVGGPGTAYQARTRSGQINRAALRYLKDPYAAWSAVAVNAENDMVIAIDENLFRIVEYSRSDNTPPGAPLTVPRRVIGGDDTHTEMMCGAYIDPKTLDVYVTNNDTQDWLPMFSREARGNAKPDRLLASPHRAWGIAADEVRQELFITVQPVAVVVYRKGAEGTEVPLRVLEGDATQLADPHGIALDLKNDLMIVANHGHRRVGGPSQPLPADEWRREWQEAMSGNSSHNFVSLYAGGEGRGAGARDHGRFELPSINIYARDARGNTAPLRVIKGPRTQLNWPSHVAVHEGRGEIFVANDSEDSVLVFRVTDNGDVAPTRVIKGARTQIRNPTGISLDAANNEVWVASMGNYTITVFPLTASGDVAPLRTIRGGPAGGEAQMIGNPGAIGYDRKRQEILVPN